MPTASKRVGKTLYGFLFIVVLPSALVVWARASEANVPLPTIGSPGVGLVVALCGLLMMAVGAVALQMHGDGLPMNPYPPRHFVSRSIYRFLAHPIYTGFTVLCIGVSIAAQSASGLWLISPIVLLGSIALVEGYEKLDLEKRFGPGRSKPLLHLPADSPDAPSSWDTISVYVFVLLPWLVLYEGVVVLGVPPDAFNLSLSFENAWPVWQWTEVIYASTYVLVIVAPLIAPSNRDLRKFAIAGGMSTLVIILLYLAIPAVAPPRVFESSNLLGDLLLFERAKDTSAAAFPSFHVLWALLAARLLVSRFPRLKVVWWMWALLISASCVTTGMHAIADVLAAFVIYFLVTRIDRVWEFIRSSSERFANSWKEWRIGPVRIINHGLFAGIGTLIGVTIVGVLIGQQQVPSILIVAFSSLIISALWAQFIEGSPKLLRPYGYYGGVVGVIVGAFIAHLLGTSVWLLLGAFCVAGPWIQSFGRLRCLIQGCCHGRETSATIGIQYHHPRSRVCRLANLSSVPIHPTPVYSILWNVVIAVVITRLWFLHAQFGMITGLYLILTGLGRFVEEAYRGEPQTPIVGGLRIYQWIAIVTVLAGAVLTALPSTGQAPALQFSWDSALAGLGFGLFTCFALGVDFPNSTKRFARLA